MRRENAQSWFWAVAFLAVPAFFIVRLQRGTGAEPIGIWPSEYELVTRETILAEPVIEIPLPNGKKFELPGRNSRNEMHRRWMELTPGSAGFIFFRPTPLPYPGHDPRIRLTWWAGDQEHFTIPYDFARHCALPYAYGTKPLEVKFQSAPSEPMLKVQLPANGKKAPVLEPLEVQVGELRVRFTPKPVLTTLRPYLYDVEIMDGNGPTVAALRIGEAAHVIDGKGVMGFFPRPGKPVACQIARVRKTPVNLRYRIECWPKGIDRRFYVGAKEVLWTYPNRIVLGASKLEGLNIPDLYRDSYYAPDTRILFGNLNPLDSRNGPMKAEDVLRAIETITPDSYSYTLPGPGVVEQNLKTVHYRAEKWMPASLKFEWPREGKDTLWRWFD